MRARPDVPTRVALPRPTASVATATREGRTILMDLAAGRYYALEGVADLVWEALVRGDSLEDTVAGLAGQFHRDPEEVRREVEEFIRDLRTRGVVR